MLGIGLKKFFWLKKLKILWREYILLVNLTVGTFYEKKLQKSNQKEIKTRKVIKRKYDKLNVKWKGYGN